MSDVPKVLVIEDEAPIRLWVCTALTANGYCVFEAKTGSEGLGAALAVRPDVILTDLGLPDVDGLEVIRDLRRWSTIPIVVTSARPGEEVKVDALNAGAMDFLSKPVPIEKLLNSVRIAVRHARPAQDNGRRTHLAMGPLDIDLVNQRVRVNDKVARLTDTEFQLLATLARHAGRLFTYSCLLTEALGPERASEIPLLKMTIAGLRRKLESDPLRPRYLLAESGVGYRLVDEPTST